MVSRLPRGNSSTFLWTTDLGRDRSVEDRSVTCQPDSREPRIVVPIHALCASVVSFAAPKRSRRRGHWCSSPRLVVTTYAAINSANVRRRAGSRAQHHAINLRLIASARAWLGSRRTSVS
jgi:hypothetical protein